MKNIFILFVLLFFINLYIFKFSEAVGQKKHTYRNAPTPINPKSYFKYPKALSVTKNSDVQPGFKEIFKQNNIRPTATPLEANLIMFPLLVDYADRFAELNTIRTPKNIYSLLCIDSFANKAVMYEVLRRNNEFYKHVLPKTYVIGNKESMTELVRDFDTSKLYILKKNVQRQKGCTITNNKQFVLNAASNNYVVCQELLQDPYLIRGHKINIRNYLVIFIQNDHIQFKLLNNGFIYYTPKPFIKNAPEYDRHITTGYIDRKIYDHNPLTIQELVAKHMSAWERNRFQQNLLRLFSFVKHQYTDMLLQYDSNHHKNFVILGCDVAIGRNMDCVLMEMNKGPDLSSKDNRDAIVKQTLMRSVMHDIGVINHPHDNFITI